MRKTIKNTFRVAMIAAVLCVGIVSAHQLSLASTPPMCRGFCTKSGGCPNILGCACVFNQPGDPVGVCGLIAAKPAH